VARGQIVNQSRVHVVHGAVLRCPVRIPEVQLPAEHVRVADASGRPRSTCRWCSPGSEASPISSAPSVAIQ
jgi:hypothetical protein